MGWNITTGYKDDAINAAKTFIEFAAKRSNTEDFVKVILTEHLTNQQSTMRLLMEVIKRMANPRYVDGRNAASVKLAKELLPIIEENPLPYI